MDIRDSRSLVEHAASGDSDALDQLFTRCRPRLRRLLQLRAGSALAHADIDDLVQESYLEATRQFDDYTYQGPDSFFRWLATVALHRIANLRRTAGAAKRDRRRERPIVGPGATTARRGSPQPAAEGPGPRTLVIGTEAEARLDAALAELAPADREVITLARFEGLALQEVADRMGRSRNAVALLLSRALRKLKAAMTPRDERGDGS